MWSRLWGPLHLDDRQIAVESLEIEFVEQPVYNFEVESLRNYTVGHLNILVHNNNGKELNRASTADNLAGAGDARFATTTETAAPRRSKLWNDPVEVNGRRVYQRDDLFDPHAVDANGRTNLERMKKGSAPVGYDGESVNLHHLTQREPGAMAEVGGRFHTKNTKTLHGVVEDQRSFRYSPDGKKTAAEKA